MLRLWNPTTGRKEAFLPQTSNAVRMYVCGPTVYDLPHLGHGRSYIVFDVLRRWLEFSGNEVRHVQNFTDIEDSIYRKAKAEGIPAPAVADRYIAEYFQDLDRLGVTRAHHYPRVTEHIPEIIAIAQRLVEKGAAYVRGGNVYFRATKVPNLDGLLQTSLEEIAVDEVTYQGPKEDPLDFAIWKEPRDGEQSWESPWGPGRPGWHIECYAMSTKYLGPQLDLHGGGLDLVFPHHHSEALLCNADRGERFSRHWVHNGFMTIRGTKMSKSLGNFVTLRDILARHESEVLRYFFLATHYRKTLEFTPEALALATTEYEIIRKADLRVRTGSSSPEKDDGDPPLPESISGIFDALNDDLDTEAALRQVRKMSAAVLDGPKELSFEQRHQGIEFFRTVRRIFGLLEKTHG